MRLLSYFVTSCSRPIGHCMIAFAPCIVLNGSLSAQPNAALHARIDQVTALLRTDPGGFDTLFSANFLDKVPAAQLVGISKDYFDKYGAVTSWRYLDSSKEWSAKVRVKLSKGFSVDMSIAATESGKHHVEGFWIGPATPQLKTLDEIAKKISKLRGTTGFLVAKLDKSSLGKVWTLAPIAAWNPDTALALGSAFKLYVLAALLKEINSGERGRSKRHWSDVIYLDSASRAFPSGQMHVWPDHAPVTLETAATLMISISDNTATDLLIHTLGRKTVEAMLRETGNSHADRDIPFLTVLEAFKLKEKSQNLGKEYVELSVEKKREFLDTKVAGFPREGVGHAEGMIDKIEWFASPSDIANVLKYIFDHSASGTGFRAREILSVNPGLPLDKSRWEYIGYKGGSEPGVLNLSFLLRSKLTDDWYVITGTWNDPDAALNESDFEGYIQRATELVP